MLVSPPEQSGRNSMKSQWFNGSNVGDLLAPLVLTGLTGETVVWSDQSPRWLVSGSILSMAQDHDTLFGVGSFERLDWMRAPQDLRILLVRGPRTAAHLGITCEIYGDCGLLMPLVYRPAQQEIQYELGIVPHYKSLEQTPVPPGARLISPGLPPRQFIEALLTCRRVASSSLHGIILAEAYGCRPRGCSTASRRETLTSSTPITTRARAGVSPGLACLKRSPVRPRRSRLQCSTRLLN